MGEHVYLRPIACAPSPQSEGGGAVRLAGTLVYASRFALIRRTEGVITARECLSVDGVESALERLPPALAEEGVAQWAALRQVHAPLVCGDRLIRLDQPRIMGILNITHDSFSDGGEWLDKPEVACAQAMAMLEAGAAIIDVGGESTRPGATAVWEGDEIKRVIPVIERLHTRGAAISVDTRRVSVMEAALAAGAHIFNDVSALRHDPHAGEFAARAHVPVVLMHASGALDGPSVADLHDGATYRNVVLDVFDWLRERRDMALGQGIAREKIVLDPGIGFGKSLADNLALMNALELFHGLGQPLLVGASRKRMIGALSHEAPADRRLGGSLMLAARAMAAGVQLLRVHDVAETAQAIHVWRGLRDAALSDFSELPDE